MHGNIVGIVLAAGQSRRMGRDKALLHTGAGEETFVSRLVRALQGGGVDEVIVVGRSTDELLRSAVRAIDGPVGYVENPSPDHGQLSSIVAGIDEAESRGAGGVLVVPVDMPLVRAGTIAAAIAAFRSNTHPIVRVSCGGRHGHPVLFRSDLFEDVRNADVAVGAKAVLRAHADRVLEVEVDDPGVLADVDVPDDYRRVFGSDPR